MRTLLACCLALFLGCASAPTAHDFDPSLTLESPEDEVWDAAIDAMGELNLSINEMERTSGFIATDWAQAPEEYMDCGDAGIADHVNRQGKFNIVVREQGDESTTLTVNSSFRAMRVFGDNRSQIQCESTGALEARMHRTVRTRIAQD